MSQVTLHVGGRPYTLSCADGEERHIEHLAGIVEGKLSSIGRLAPGEAKNLLIAALILADEVDEARRAAVSPVGFAPVAAPVSGPVSDPAPAPAPPSDDTRTVETLTALAVRLEDLAQMVEKHPRNV